MHTAKVTISIAILIAIIIGTSLFASGILSSSAKKLENHISELESTTKAGNWREAERQLSFFNKDWSGMEKSWSVLLDHIEIDNIDTSIVRIEKFIDTKNKSMALAEVATLMQFIKHIPEKEAFKLKNIF